jgi:hypothetical protein
MNATCRADTTDDCTAPVAVRSMPELRLTLGNPQ